MAAANGSGDSGLRQGQLVFVYGTLKRGQANHHQLAGSAYCGEALLPELALYNLGPFPMAIACGDPGAALQGELYAVTDAQLAALDRFEGVPRLYERQQRRLSDGRAVWVYVGRPRQVRHVPRIPSGVWGAPLALAAALLGPGLLLMAPALGAGDLRRDCLALQRSHGQERIAIANRIGHEHLLTKNRHLAEPHPGDTTSLYRWSDLQRLCRDQ